MVVKEENGLIWQFERVWVSVAQRREGVAWDVTVAEGEGGNDVMWLLERERVCVLWLVGVAKRGGGCGSGCDSGRRGRE